MAQVTLRINGYSYLVGCEDGQERHLQAMGDAVQSRIDSIKALGQTGRLQLAFGIVFTIGLAIRL